ncbi:MAG: hypothetical protein ABSB49_06060 [Polyangia bacterium]|jgi:hypothetical protein
MSLPSSTEFDGSSKDAVIVLRVKPVARVSITAGTVNRAGWRMSPGHSAYGAWAEDGTIIIKVTPRGGSETYGITVVTPDDGRYARYQAKRGVFLPTFHAVAGQVTFVGAIRIERSETSDTVSVVHDEDPDDGQTVTKLMKRRYPRIRAKVVTEIFEAYPREDEPSTNGSPLAAPWRDD